MGPYDFVAITGPQDEVTAAQFTLSLGMEGNVRTTGLRAFNEDEMANIVQGLG